MTHLVGTGVINSEHFSGTISSIDPWCNRGNTEWKIHGNTHVFLCFHVNS